MKRTLVSVVSVWLGLLPPLQGAAFAGSSLERAVLESRVAVEAGSLAEAREQAFKALEIGLDHVAVIGSRPEEKRESGSSPSRGFLSGVSLRLGLKSVQVPAPVVPAVNVEVSPSKWIKRFGKALSLLPAGQYLIAKKNGRSEEDLKWFKRLESFRAAFLVLVAAGAAIGDPLSIAINLIAYGLSSFPANVDPPKKEDLQGGTPDFNTGLRSVFSSPRLAVYVSINFLANNLAAFGGPDMLYAQTSPFTDIDYITHLIGGIVVGKLLDEFYEASGTASRFAAGIQKRIRKMGDGFFLNKPVKTLLEKIARHPKPVLVLASFAAIGPLWESLELTGSYLFRSSSTAVAALKESAGNWSRDIVMNALGGITSYLWDDDTAKASS